MYHRIYPLHEELGMAHTTIEMIHSWLPLSISV